MFNLTTVVVFLSLLQALLSIPAGLPREESGVIAGLFRNPSIYAQSNVLHRRQSAAACDSGTFACSDGKGCCPNGSDCGVYSGKVGCCHVGYTCVANDSPCVQEGEAGCPGTTNCCLNADVCMLDGSGDVNCLITSWGRFGNATGLNFNDTTAGTISTTPRVNVPSGAGSRFSIAGSLWLSACLLVLNVVGIY